MGGEREGRGDRGEKERGRKLFGPLIFFCVRPILWAYVYAFWSGMKKLMVCKIKEIVFVFVFMVFYGFMLLGFQWW